MDGWNFNADIRDPVRAHLQRSPEAAGWAESGGGEEGNGDGRERQMCIIGKCALSG